MEETNCPWSKCRPWSTTKRHGCVSANPSDVLGTDMARTWKLRAVPLGRGSCTAVHRLPDIQFLPNSTYSVRYADTQLGTGGCSQGQQTRPPRARPRRQGSRDTTVPRTAGKGMLRLGFKLKFSFQGLWKSLPGLHNPAAKSNLKWLEPRSEIGKYLCGDQFLFTQTKPNFQPPQNENWQQDVLICMHKTHILLIQS